MWGLLTRLPWEILEKEMTICSTFWYTHDSWWIYILRNITMVSSTTISIMHSRMHHIPSIGDDPSLAGMVTSPIPDNEACSWSCQTWLPTTNKSSRESNWPETAGRINFSCFLDNWRCFRLDMDWNIPESSRWNFIKDFPIYICIYRVLPSLGIFINDKWQMLVPFLIVSPQTSLAVCRLTLIGSTFVDERQRVLPMSGSSSSSNSCLQTSSRFTIQNSIHTDVSWDRLSTHRITQLQKHYVYHGLSLL